MDIPEHAFPVYDTTPFEFHESDTAVSDWLNAVFADKHVSGDALRVAFLLTDRCDGDDEHLFANTSKIDGLLPSSEIAVAVQLLESRGYVARVGERIALLGTNFCGPKPQIWDVTAPLLAFFTIRVAANSSEEAIAEARKLRVKVGDIADGWNREESDVPLSYFSAATIVRT